MRLSDYPQLSPLLNGIRATLAGDRSTLEKSFKLSFKADEPGWQLTFEPLASESRPLYVRIRICGDHDIVKSVTLERTTGERMTMTLSQLANS